MIKARIRAHSGQPQLLLLGLSEMNIQRLKEGQPIYFDAKAFGYDGNICIVYGKTEQDIVEVFDLPKSN